MLENNGTSLTRYGVLLVAMQERQQGNRALPSSVAMEAMIFTGGEIGDICPWRTKKTVSTPFRRSGPPSRADHDVSLEVSSLV
jgi:hypothetical protein